MRAYSQEAQVKQCEQDVSDHADDTCKELREVPVV